MAVPVLSIRTPDDIEKLGTILGIWAHPDDESFTCAGIMATAIHNGQKVACITATKGEKGIQDAKRWPPEKLGDIRASEMVSALKAIGIEHHHWLDYPDGGCQDVDVNQAVTRIAGLIELYHPQTIMTFGPDGMTGHPDHQTVSKWAHLALKKTGLDCTIYHAVQSQEMYDKYLKAADEKFNIFFNIDKPPLRQEGDTDIYYRLPEDVLKQKFAALEAMPSQTEGMLKNTPITELHESFGIECFEPAI